MNSVKIRLLIIAPLLWFCGCTSQQGSPKNGVASPSGTLVPSVNVAVCQPLSTTAATVTNNQATLTMSSNPMTAGFAPGMTMVVAGFTGADTYFNGGSIINGQIVNGFTIISTTPTTITYALVHANAAATSNGTALQEGNPTMSCGGLVPIYTDGTLGQAASNPATTSELANWGFWAPPGQYSVQLSGPTVTTRLIQEVIDCVPQNTPNCGATLNTPNIWGAPQTFNAGITTTATTSTGTGTHTGAETFANINTVRYVDGMKFTTIAAALADLGGPGTVTVPPGNYSVNSTITLTKGQHLISNDPCLLGPGSLNLCGAIITWTGAASTPVINMHNASGASVEGISVDCANVAGCIAYLYDSNNSPVSALNTFKTIAAKGFHFGLVIGLPSLTPDTNNFEADTMSVEEFQFYGNPADTTAVGILVNSGNGGQLSTIDRGNIQFVNIGAECVKSNGQISYTRFNAGSPSGMNPTVIQNDTNCSFGPKLEQMESEGAWSYPVHDSSNSYTASNATWVFNQFNTTPAGRVLIDGNASIVSIANQGGNTVWTNSGTGKVLSLGESVWGSSANAYTWNSGVIRTLQVAVTNANGVQYCTGAFASCGNIHNDTAGGLILTDTNGHTWTLQNSGRFAGGAGLPLAWTEGSTPSANSALDICYGDSTAHAIKCSYNDGTFLDLTQTVASGTSTLGNIPIGAGTCAMTVTTTVTGAVTTDVITWSYANFGSPATDGVLILNAWPTENNINFALCNTTPASIRPSGLVVNWKIVR